MVKVSVIIPVYGVAKYIEKCVESLLAQTLEEMEFFMVDDHGPDNSIELAKKAIAGHPREQQFHFLTPEHNLGAAGARNFAFPHAQGEYVAFVDSDDYIEPDMYEKLYTQAQENQCEWCYSQMVKEYPDGRQQLLAQPAVPEGELTPDIRRQMLIHFVAYFTTSIYRRDFLIKHRIYFPEYRFSEDSYFVWKVVMHAQRFSFIEHAFYHYIMQQNSVTNLYNENKHRQKVEVFSLLLNNLKSEQLYAAYKPELDYLYIKKGLLIPLAICAIHTNYKQRMSEVFAAATKAIPDFWQNDYLKKNFPIRILLYLAKTMPCVFRAVMNVYSKKQPEMF